MVCLVVGTRDICCCEQQFFVSYSPEWHKIPRPPPSWVNTRHERVKAHLHYIRDLGPSIRVRARPQSKQLNWCFVFTLIRVQVLDFCLGRPVSELFATCSDFLGRRHPSTSEVMKRACSKPPVHVVATKFGPKWPWTQMTSDPSLGCSVNTILSGSQTRTRTWMLRQCN